MKSEVADISIGPTTKYDISKDKENQARKGTDVNPRINYLFLNDFVSLIINYDFFYKVKVLEGQLNMKLDLGNETAH